MAKFILLRDCNTGRLRPADTRDTLPEPVLEVADLSARDLRDATRDPAVCAFARAMPTRLIEPEPLDEARPEDALPGWGRVATGADRCPATGVGIRVAVLDTGIDAGHPAFAGMELLQQDFAGSGSHDSNGHGTHVAGTIFGSAVDGASIGIASGITMALVAKVLTDDGRGSTEMLYRALCWAIAEQARVIAFSVQFDVAGQTEILVQRDGFPVLLAGTVALESHRMNLRLFRILCDMLRLRAGADGGVLFVAAAGNDTRRIVSPEFEVRVSGPAAAPGVISVGAAAVADEGLRIAPFSNTNPVLTAPGVGIVSAASGGGLRALNGTSMACAHAAGLAALWAEALSGLPGSIETAMCAGATPSCFDPGLCATDFGLGLIRAPARGRG